MNAINYLLQEDALISVRSRSIALRPLDEERIRQERQGWQFVAVGMPLLVVFIVAGAVLTTRRRLFGRAVNDLRIMHANLRILYVLIALTMVTAGVVVPGRTRKFGPNRRHRFCHCRHEHRRQDFHRRHGRRQVTLTRPTQARCGMSMANSKPVRTPSTCC